MSAPDAGTDCDRFREVAAEVALGLVTGHERAAALAHLRRCPECLRHTAQLGALHDRLRALIPPAEPPAGFEQRVLERIGVPARAARPRRRRRVAAAVALAAALGAPAFAGGWAAGTALRPPAAVVASPLVDGDRHVGDVLVSRERPASLSVYLTVARPGRLTCQLLRADGSVAATETYDAAGGTEWWGLDRPAGEVSAIRVSDADGDVVGAGNLPRP